MAKQNFAIYRADNAQLIGTGTGLESPVISFLELRNNQGYTSVPISEEKLTDLERSLTEEPMLLRLRQYFTKSKHRYIKVN